MNRGEREGGDREREGGGDSERGREREGGRKKMGNSRGGSSKLIF